MFFKSDNAGAVAPQIVEAMTEAASVPTGSYGDDPYMNEVRELVREIFEAPEAETYLVATGTAANSLLLATICPPWGTVLCHRNAHVNEDECNAPEFFSGAKLTLLEGAHAKIDPASMARTIRTSAPHGVHNPKLSALTVSNVTEFGAVYSPAELRELTAMAKANNLRCHMDGARFANAVVSAGCTPAELSWKAGIDVLSLGAAKNGCVGVEAVVLFDPSLAQEFEYRRKRGGHLISKHRLMSAQMARYLKGSLWLELAANANAKAGALADALQQVEGIEMRHPADANLVFPEISRSLHRKIRAAGVGYYIWDLGVEENAEGDDRFAIRLVTNCCTSDAEIEEFLEAVGS